MLCISSETFLYFPASDLGWARGLAIILHRNAVECGNHPFSVEILLFRGYRNQHAVHPVGRLAAEIKMKLCMLIFVLSMDAFAYHINYVILSICFYSVYRPVPVEKDVKIYGVGPKRQRWSNKPTTIWKLKNLDYLLQNSENHLKHASRDKAQLVPINPQFSELTTHIY